MAICHGRSSSAPVNGSTARPRRSTTSPVAVSSPTVIRTVEGSADALNTRTDEPAVVAQHGRDLGALDVRAQRPYAGTRPLHATGADPFERHEQRVGGRVQVGVAPRPPVREHGVVDGVPALQLRSFEWVERAGRVGSQRELRARQVPRRPQERQRELAARTVRGVDDLVLEEPVVQQREALLAVGAVDEATRHERRQAHLVRPALRGEPAVHDGERALGVGALDRRGEREVGAETVVAAAVVELGVDPQEALAGAQLERGADLDELGLVAPAAARALVAHGVPGQLVGRDDERPGLGPDRARSSRRAPPSGGRRPCRRREGSSCTCRRRHRRRPAGCHPSRRHRRSW